MDNEIAQILVDLYSARAHLANLHNRKHISYNTVPTLRENIDKQLEKIQLDILTFYEGKIHELNELNGIED